MKRLFGVLAGALLLIAVPVIANAAQDKGKGEAKSSASKSMSATGTVKNVSADSLTITTKTGEETFAVDSKTNVTATGASHKSDAMKSEKKATQITDFVKVGDSVSVRYHDMGGTKHAASVRVTRKAAPAKK
jgi:Cu/Ag efflux protein CusF